jgi:hypothetical protein
MRMLIEPSDGDWTVSAAAVYLLRTLSRSHTKQQPIAEHLFPCCGNGMFEAEGEDVLIIGCNSGIDIEVVQAGDEVLLTTDDEARYALPFSDWRVAVCHFADAVQAFYSASAPKKPEDDTERTGFVRLTKEWARRRRLAEEAGAESSSTYPCHFPLVDPAAEKKPVLAARVVQWLSKTKS